MADPIAQRVAARFIAEVVGTEHPSEEAKKKYLKDHPNADPAKHTVKKNGPKPPPSETDELMSEHERKNPGSINWDYDPKKNKRETVKDETDDEAAARRKKHGLPDPSA